MRQTSLLCVLSLASAALAARPVLNEPVTMIDKSFETFPIANGNLPDLSRILGLPDFDWAARQSMNNSAYTRYSHGSGGEWSYRNNLEVFERYRFRPRVMVDLTDIESSMETTILGHKFSAPYFISPCATAGLAHAEGEIGLLKAAAEQDIFYIPSFASSVPLEKIAAARPHIYISNNKTANSLLFRRIEKMGAKAMVLTVDSTGDRRRHRALRFENTNQTRSASYIPMTWAIYRDLQKLTNLPIVPKGIQTVEDAVQAVEDGAPAIFLSNHGGRALDGSPSAFEVALEIHKKAPQVFKNIEVYADGGVRYGTDVPKLLALGIRAIGLCRSFMYANLYGVEGVSRAAMVLKREITASAAFLGVADLKKINSSFLELSPIGWYS
ncbi:FMN hydroxy acid dehydrogenase domain-containing protein [Fusarium falciforme]|uniref:FMN hydroxy acid dehydrogenase domain-containing protein n=1 Tax=Fusarium falciforme TaxID=195108 RepID=UPI00230128DC|nr:FMN hydroxy acid dehydrogenase domain-containing protein [Fusarium falciforme]WAO93407.1 FMN hydroxy acid dehydrogenase domain-containing protein [Fusarium falciforme]